MVKARGCADGRSQRQYTDKEGARSPMVSLEAMMMSCCIDIKKGSYIVVTDIPSAFLHADMTIYQKYIWRDKKASLCYTYN